MSTHGDPSECDEVGGRDGVVVAVRAALAALALLLVLWGLSYAWMIRAGMLRSVAHELLVLALASVVLVRVGIEAARWCRARTREQILEARGRMAAALLYASSVYCVLHACHHLSLYVLWIFG
jgi:hypothetical protein